METLYSLSDVTEVADLRSIWPNESKDLTPWLGDNIDFLGNALGINLSLEETEYAVGRYTADIVATETGSNRTVVIENQITKTDHDHLGKLITYASGIDAKILIWLVGESDEEHRAAVAWLNANTADDIYIFLIELKTVKIPDGKIFPMFNIVERPNTWKKEQQQCCSDLGRIYYKFWERFIHNTRENSDFAREFQLNKIPPKVSYTYYSMGYKKPDIRIMLSATKKLAMVDIRFTDEYKYLYQRLYESKALSENEDIGELRWQNEKSKTEWFIGFVNEFDISNEVEWDFQFNTIMRECIFLKELFYRFCE